MKGTKENMTTNKDKIVRANDKTTTTKNKAIMETTTRKDGMKRTEQ